MIKSIEFHNSLKDLSPAELLTLHRQMAQNRFEYFFSYYLVRYKKYEFAPFHQDIFKLITSNNPLNEIIAFRESAKSTVVTMAYILWCILFRKKRFIIVCSDTYTQAQLHLSNVIHELENNELVIGEFGSLKSEKWTEGNFVTNTGVRVIARGTGSKIRGLRHLEFRPDLFIGDDLENNELVATIEQRNKTERWLETEVLGAMAQENGQVIVVGNMIHYDSVIARLRLKPMWQHLEIPIMVNGVPSWKQRHTPESIEEIKKRVGTINFAQEFMLQPLMESDQIIRRSWIKYYDEINPQFIKRVVIALDPAVSEKQSADFSAITVWALYTDGNVYCLHYVNEHLTFDQIIKTIRNLYDSYKEYNTEIAIEKVAAQDYLVQHLVSQYHLPVKRVIPKGDKRSRLISVSTYFENGIIYFKKTHDTVTMQLCNFGAEKHDDLVDSTIYGIEQLLATSHMRGFAKTNLRI